jgi:putative flippase GtrA
MVFGKSSHHFAKEFMLVFVASVVGLGLQLAVVATSVEWAGLYPLVGKLLSILTSFFWNYWFRATYVYRQKPEKPVV